jgi:hypothetical protein
MRVSTFKNSLPYKGGGKINLTLVSDCLAP